MLFCATVLWLERRKGGGASTPLRWRAARVLISLSTVMARAASGMQWEQIHKLRIRRVGQFFGPLMGIAIARKTSGSKWVMGYFIGVNY